MFAVRATTTTPRKYLKATGREAIADLADQYAELLRNDPEVDADPGRYYDRVIEIDLSTLEPHLVGPHTPDLDRPISEIAADAEREGYPARDLGRARRVVHQLVVRGHRPRRAHRAPGDGEGHDACKTPLMITPGSEQVRATIERDGLLADLEAIGATVLANACGPCIGQWKRDDAPGGPEHDRHVVQPQLPGPQRRQQGHARVHRFAGDRGRHGADGPARR